MNKQEKVDNEFTASFIEIQELEKVIASTEENLAYMKSALKRMKLQLHDTKSEILKL